MLCNDESSQVIKPQGYDYVVQEDGAHWCPLYSLGRILNLRNKYKAFLFTGLIFIELK